MATPEGLFHGTFVNEVRSMMYTFGDIKSPSQESALLIESMTLKQMRELIKLSSDICNIRGGKSISITDLFFLFRKNKVKLKRIIRFIELKKLCRRASQNSPLEEGSVPDYGDAGQGENKREKYSLDFLTKEDQEEIFSDEMDQVQKQRLENLDALTQDMDVSEYKEFSESRQANFHKNMAKFKEWLDFSSFLPSVKINQSVYDVLGYLAYDTVQEIVELALVVKNEQEGRSCDHEGRSCDHEESSSCSPHASELPMFFNVPTSTTTTGSTSSPPTSPKSPAGNSLSSPTQVVSKPKPRKRGRPPKNPVLTSVNPEPTPVVVLPPAPPTAIQPHHVLEALRRCSTSLIGPMVPLKTYYSKQGIVAGKLFCT